MATTPIAAPRYRPALASSPFDCDSPGSSDCSVIFGAHAGSPSPRELAILTPISRRDTLVLPGFAGHSKDVDRQSAQQTNPYLLLNASSPGASRSPSPTKGRFLSPLVPRATPRSAQSSGSSENDSPDKEILTPRRSSRRKPASAGMSFVQSDSSTASPSRSLRFSGTPKSTRKDEDVSEAPDKWLEETVESRNIEEREMISESAERIEVHLYPQAQDWDYPEREEESLTRADTTETENTASDLLPSTIDPALLKPSPLSTDLALSPTERFDFIARRDALSYDSDELTDADADGSYEVYSDEDVEVATSADEDLDVESVLTQLEELRVEESEPTMAEEASDEEGTELDQLSDSVLSGNEEEQEQEQQEEAEDIDKEPTTESDPEEIAEDEDLTPTASVVPVGQDLELLGFSAAIKSNEHERQPADNFDEVVEAKALDSAPVELAEPLPIMPSLPVPSAESTPRRSPRPPRIVTLTPAAPQPDQLTKGAPSASETPARALSVTPSHAKETSTTPSAVDSKRQITMAAPTARRQLTKLTSKPAARVGTSGADSARVLGGIAHFSALPGQRRLGMAKSALPVRSSPPGRPTKSALPTPSSLPTPSTSALPTLPRSKIGALSKPVLKLAAPSSTSSSFAGPPRPTTASRMLPPAARKVASVPVARSAASITASNPSRQSTMATSRARTAAPNKSLKPPSATSSSIVARPVPTVTLARKGLAAMASSSTTRAGPSIGPRTASSTSALAPRSVTVPSTPLPVVPLAPPASALSRPPSAPPSLALPSRLLPPLAQNQSAPPVLSVETRSITPPAPAAVPIPPPPPSLPLLPRPTALNPTPRSPEKRSAQRVVREMPTERSTTFKIDAENVAPRLASSTGSSASLSSQPRTALAPTQSLPMLLPSNIAPVSPIKPVRLAASASLPPLPRPTPRAEQPTVLTASADKVDAEVVAELFGAPPAQELLPPPIRSTRAQRTKAVAEVAIEPTPEPLPLLPRPTRRSRMILVEEPEAQEETARPCTPATTRVPFTFTPAPALTQDELSRLTQKNTKRNQLHFNKLDVQTIMVDSNRPPSPTSKIRRSIGNEGAAGRPTTKEGREARAAKRRSALRSSTDGSEFERLQQELGAVGGSGEEPKGPVVHYRAPGDEEEYMSPARPLKMLKSGKKKESAPVEGERRSVKWDKALVYEGPLSKKAPSADGILKRIPLDAFGNSTNTSKGFAKPAPVQIKKYIYRDDE